MKECRTVCSEISKLISFVWNKEQLPEQWKESIILSIYNIKINIREVGFGGGGT
jgi:hypothetical protein